MEGRPHTPETIDQYATAEGLAMNDDYIRKTPVIPLTEIMLVDVDTPLGNGEEPRDLNDAPRSSITTINTRDDDTSTLATQTKRSQSEGKHSKDTDSGECVLPKRI
jgi:hypothetical protein